MPQCSRCHEKRTFTFELMISTWFIFFLCDKHWLETFDICSFSCVSLSFFFLLLAKHVLLFLLILSFKALHALKNCNHLIFYGKLVKKIPFILRSYKCFHTRKIFVSFCTFDSRKRNLMIQMTVTGVEKK